MKIESTKEEKVGEISSKDDGDVSLSLGGGIGCLFMSIGIAIILWALQGFPGLR